MKLPIFVRPEAERDIEEAARWYDQQFPGLGEEFLSEATTVLNRIEEHPELYSIVAPGIRRSLLARFPFAVRHRRLAPAEDNEFLSLEMGNCAAE